MSSQSVLASDYKGPGGKLVRIRLTEDHGLIRRVKITGDFFLIPEERLPKPDEKLEDVHIREKELRLLVDRFFRGTEAQALVITPYDLVKAILATKQETTS